MEDETGRREVNKMRLAHRLIHDGNLSAALVLASSLALGLALGFALPTDDSLPGGWARASSVLGWTSFSCWFIGWYPQLLMNALKRSVVGLSFDFAVISFVSFACYTAFNCVMYWSASVRSDYERQHGGQSIDVRSNDVVFSIHANAATALTLVQICVYQRGDQGVSRWMWAALAASGVAVAGYAAALAAGARAFSVLGLLYLLSYIKLAGSAVKYIPQIALQRANASTEGFTIANALTDLGGGVLSMAQQVLDAVALRDASLVTGNPVKLGLGLISIAYCIVLAVQHYCLYARPPQRSRYRPLPSDAPA